MEERKEGYASGKGGCEGEGEGEREGEREGRGRERERGTHDSLLVTILSHSGEPALPHSPLTLE